MVKEKVWIPGSTERVWIAPVFTAAVDGEGRPVNVLVEPGYYRTVTIPGRYQMITRKVWVPTSKPVPVTHFTLRNSRRFQIQVQSIHVALADGSTAVVHLPRDNVISSTSHFTFDIPDGAVSVRLRFKTWSWGNKRFQFPIYSAAYELNRSNTGIIH
ncbi:MAG: hypothetical protein CMJ18_05355 [Phycisphaeraceae bacterium]|nr:hypothetical protein [Phycisphaeraceae bacterium]